MLFGRIPRLIIVLSICAFAYSLALSQTKTNSTGTGGIHEIRGRVYLPSGLSLDTPVEIELQSVTFGSLKVMTDSGGSYSFTNLAPGSYSVIVNGNEQFETFRDSMTIDPEVQGAVPMPPHTRIFTIPVYLQAHRSRGPEQKTGVVNAKWSSIPGEAVHHWEHGNDLVTKKQLPEAEAEFNKAIFVAPTFAPAYASLGKLLLSLARVDEAISQLHMAIRNDPEDYDSRLTIGVAFLNNKEMEAAVRELKHAAVLNKTAAAPRYYLGVVFVERRSLDPAQAEFEAARDMNGDKSFKLLHRYLGGIYIAKQMNKEAVAELELYIAQNPTARDGDKIKQTIADLKSKVN